MRGGRALPIALDLAAAPALAAGARTQPLPDGVIDVIRIAAGCEDTLAEAARATDCDPAFIKAAAEFYIKQILLHSGSDSRRILGVSPKAGREEMRNHMRWLMLWLHPDHAKSDWQAAFAQRVIAAWRDVGGGAAPPAPLRAGTNATQLPAQRQEEAEPIEATGFFDKTLTKILLACVLIALAYALNESERGAAEALLLDPWGGR